MRRIVSVALSPEQFRKIGDAAATANLPITRFIHDAAMEGVQPVTARLYGVSRSENITALTVELA